MAELGLRLLVACAIGIAAVAGVLPDTVLIVSAVTFVYAVVGHALSKRNPDNSGIAGFTAALDACAISLVLGAAGKLETMAFFAVLPLVYASSKYGSDPIAMAPLGAGSILIAHALWQSGNLPPALYGQALGSLGLALLLPRSPRIVTTEVADHVTEAPAPLVAAAEPAESLLLRERFRSLRDEYENLSERSSDERLLASILPTRFLPAKTAESTLVDAVREVLDVEGCVLYGVASFGPRLVVRAVSGTSDTVCGEPIEVDLRHSVAKLKSQLDSALQSDSTNTQNVILSLKGKVAGVIAIHDRDPERCSVGKRKLEAIGSVLASLIFDIRAKAQQARRLAEIEVLYEVATLTQGAASPLACAERIVHSLFDRGTFDHVGASFLDDHDALPTCTKGEPLRLLDAMSFGTGPGVLGWLRAGAPDLAIYQTSDDSRVPQQEAVKRRIGAFAAIPIVVNQKVFGVITAATHRSGGIDRDDIESLSLHAAELGQAIARVTGSDHSGVTTAREFAGLISGQSGSLVFGEPMNVRDLESEFGRPVLRSFILDFAKRTRNLLPENGAVCVRANGGLVAFLPNQDAEAAQRWADSWAIEASNLAMRSPDGRIKTPLGIRVKVAQFGWQSSQFSEELVA